MIAGIVRTGKLAVLVLAAGWALPASAQNFHYSRPGFSYSQGPGGFSASTPRYSASARNYSNPSRNHYSSGISYGNRRFSYSQGTTYNPGVVSSGSTYRSGNFAASSGSTIVPRSYSSTSGVAYSTAGRSMSIGNVRGNIPPYQGGGAMYLGRDGRYHADPAYWGGAR
ncbi:MAG: hypothetical protein U0800_18550 [Isosphaeraceae bacterium]